MIRGLSQFDAKQNLHEFLHGFLHMFLHVFLLHVIGRLIVVTLTQFVAETIYSPTIRHDDAASKWRKKRSPHQLHVPEFLEDISVLLYRYTAQKCRAQRVVSSALLRDGLSNTARQSAVEKATAHCSTSISNNNVEQ